MIRVLDIQRIPAFGDPQIAVHNVEIPARIAEESSDLLVVGGGTGGVAAALAASRAGLHVSVLEETRWLGGQFTAQGISALDEHEYIESFGGTRSYYEMRDRIRAVYRRRYPTAAGERYLNPGGCWVTRLAFEPSVAVEVLADMLAPQVAAGRVTIHLRRKAVAVEMAGERVKSVASVGLEDGSFLRHSFRHVIDATELGDLLPLAGLPYALGAETIADTGEPHAQPNLVRPEAVQSLTYPVALRLSRGGSSLAEPPSPPPGYATYRSVQPYSLEIHVRAGEIYGDTTGRLAYGVFDRLPNTKGGLWDYRRLVDGATLGLGRDEDISIFNWPGNDFRDRSIVDRPIDETAASLQEAKWVSLGFLHWIRTEAPGAGGGTAYPEIVPAPDVYGTPDALALHPYIREGRRIIGRTRVVEQDVSVEFQAATRARQFDDSVGVGWYPIDIHAASPDDIGVSTQTRPFQIPLGALVPRAATNLLAGGKNLATTHITNGCYRLHPVEWNTGESAGLLAAFCQERACEPADVVADLALRRSFQRGLTDRGVPLVWFVDVGVDHPAFASLQAAAAAGEIDMDPNDLHACRLSASDRRRHGIDARCAGPA
jgi:FAD-dependent oxidoreductase family protein